MKTRIFIAAILVIILVLPPVCTNMVAEVPDVIGAVTSVPMPSNSAEAEDRFDEADTQGEKGRIHGFGQVLDTYSCEGEGRSIEEIAHDLYERLLADTMKADNTRSFTITEYREPTLYIIGADQWEPDRPYSDMIDENTWYASAVLNVKYDGELSPAGPGSDWVEIDLGERYICRENDIYSLVHVSCMEPRTRNNDVFTDEFFADVVEICDTTIDPPVTGERMEAVIRYLKGLILTPTQEHLTAPSEDGQIHYGGLDYLTFRKADGTEVTVLRSAQELTMSGERSYIAQGENLNAGLKEAVGQSKER